MQYAWPATDGRETTAGLRVLGGRGSWHWRGQPAGAVAFGRDQLTLTQWRESWGSKCPSPSIPSPPTLESYLKKQKSNNNLKVLNRVLAK